MAEQAYEFLRQMVETPSATGTEWQVAGLVRERLAQIADEIETDVMGSVHARLHGTTHGLDDPAPSVLIAAHIDEIGLMVNYIDDEGFLHFKAVGGVDAGLLPGLRMDVHASEGTLRGVVGRMPIHLVPADDRKQVASMEKLCIDLGLSAEEVKSRVRIGDTITYGVGFERFGDNLAVSRAFDDKSCVYITTRVLEELKARGDVESECIFAATVQEEIGLRGGQTSAFSVKPDIALGFDVTHATDYPGVDKAKHGEVRLGAGPVIARGPNINPVVFERLVAAAEAEGIAYQLEAEPGITGTDAGAMQVQHGGIATGLVSLPLRYMHTPTEVISLDDVEATIKLLVRFVVDLEPGLSFVPGM